MCQFMAMNWIVAVSEAWAHWPELMRTPSCTDFGFVLEWLLIFFTRWAWIRKIKNQMHNGIFARAIYVIWWQCEGEQSFFYCWAHWYLIRHRQSWRHPFCPMQVHPPSLFFRSWKKASGSFSSKQYKCKVRTWASSLARLNHERTRIWLTFFILGQFLLSDPIRVMLICVVVVVVVVMRMMVMMISNDAVLFFNELFSHDPRRENAHFFHDDCKR